jgi:hypothetical protein
VEGELAAARAAAAALPAAPPPPPPLDAGLSGLEELLGGFATPPPAAPAMLQPPAPPPPINLTTALAPISHLLAESASLRTRLAASAADRLVASGGAGLGAGASPTLDSPAALMAALDASDSRLQSLAAEARALAEPPLLPGMMESAGGGSGLGGGAPGLPPPEVEAVLGPLRTALSASLVDAADLRRRLNALARRQLCGAGAGGGGGGGPSQLAMPGAAALQGAAAEAGRAGAAALAGLGARLWRAPGGGGPAL